MSQWRALRWACVLSLGLHLVLVTRLPLLHMSAPEPLGALETRWMMSAAAAVAPASVSPANRALRPTPPPRPARPRTQQEPVRAPNGPPAAFETKNSPHVGDFVGSLATVSIASQTESVGANPQPQAAPTEPAAAAASLALPGSMRLTYDLRAAGNAAYAGSAELLWQHDGSAYEARLRVGNVLRERVQTSTGRIDGSGLSPHRFVDKTRSEVATHFQRQPAGPDAALGEVVFSNNRPNIPIRSGLQDRVSVWVQLAARAAAAPPQADQELRVPTVGSAQAEDWVFRVAAPERLELPGGTLDTWKLERNLRHEHDQRIEVWLAPALQWLPARIRITQAKGDVLEQLWAKTSTP